MPVTRRWGRRRSCPLVAVLASAVLVLGSTTLPSAAVDGGADPEAEARGAERPDGRPTVAAERDGVDSVTFNPALGYPGPTIRTGTDPITLLPVTNTVRLDVSAEGFASVWVDWNEDGDFTDAAERVADARPVGAGANDVTFPGFDNPADIRTDVRVRYSTDASTIHSPTGGAPGDEVEDYRVLVERLVVPAACSPVDEPYYAMTFQHVGPVTGGTGATGTQRLYSDVAVVRGRPVDMRLQVIGGSATLGGLAPGTTDDAAWNLPGGGATLRYSFVEAGTTTPIAVNGVWTFSDMDATERAAIRPAFLSGYAVTPASSVAVAEDPDYVRFAGTVSGNAEPSQRFQIWFRDQTAPEIAWNGFANSGFGVDADSDVPVEASCDDYGDAPDTYATTLAAQGPHHTITPGLRLGATSEFDADGQPTVGADGDDTNRTDDEDGVTEMVATTGLPATARVAVTNSAATAATLAGWIDLDRSGGFDPDERVVVAVPGGVVARPFDLTFGRVSGSQPTYARFRLFPGSVPDPLPTGAAAGGEVEDHRVEVRVPRLSVVKTSTATAETRAGDTVTYTVTLTNTGTDDYTQAQPARVVDDLTDVLDDAVYGGDAAVAVDGQPADAPSYAEPRLTWSGPLAVGEAAVLTYTVRLTGRGDGVAANTAFVPAPGGPTTTPACTGDAAAPCDVETFRLPRLELTKTANRTQLPAVGQTVTYTVTVTNAGPGDYTPARPATFVDDLSDVLDDTHDPTAITASSGTADVEPPEVTWRGALPAGQSATITYRVAYTGAGDQRLVNSACVPASEALEPTEACRSVSVPGSGLHHDKAVDPATGTPVEVGQVLTYTLTFDNDGGTSADVDTSDDLRDVLDDADLVGAVEADAGLAATVVGDRLEIEGQVPTGATRTVTYRVRVRDWVAQGDHELTNVLGCEPGEPAGCAPESTSNPVRHLTVTKTAVSDPEPDTGDTVDYTITVVNDGALDLSAEEPAAVVDDLSDVLDDAVLAGTPTASTGEVRVSGDVLTWSGAMAVGDVATIAYRVTITNLGDHRLVNAAGVPGCTADDCADAVTTLLPHVVPRKLVDPPSGSPVQPGDLVTYVLAWTNDGPVAGRIDAEDDLSDVLDDADLTRAPASTSRSVRAVVRGDRLRVTGTLDPGDRVTVSYQVTVRGADDGNHNLSNVLAPDAPQVACPSVDTCGPVDPSRTTNAVGVLEDWKTVDPPSGTSVQPGRRVTYTLHFGNTGTAAVAVDRIDDLGGVLDDARVVGSPRSSSKDLTVLGPAAGLLRVTGALAPGARATVRYTVQVLDGAHGDGDLRNHLLDPGEATPRDCRADDPDRPDCTSNPRSPVTVRKTADPAGGTVVAAGDVITYTLTLRNRERDRPAASAPVAAVDRLVDVLDDADLVSGPTVDSPRLRAERVGSTIRLSGRLGPGEVVRVTYAVRVSGDGDAMIRNAVAMGLDGVVGGCPASSDQCTEHVVSPSGDDGGSGDGDGAGGGGGPLPDTGSPVEAWVPVLAVVLVGLGLLLLWVRRRPRSRWVR
ncbi:GEVED domain-containing protein [Nocardioides plantarum]|uniref:GEVED domain-containing protein n=1 Tax=Nocardioides plantarum TaxID=29299 RepID=A0ABV5KA33_9ACTN|nr:GEVED domain-containing protein [Nocardioides plantarum]